VKVLPFILPSLFIYGLGIFFPSLCARCTNWLLLRQIAELFDEQKTAAAKQKGNGEPHYWVFLGSEMRNSACEQYLKAAA